MTLARFLDAQAAVYADALAELRAGKKHTHWIWFVLPQLRGLGHSANAIRYGLENAAEAAAYLTHPVLGPRLRECVAAMLTHTDKSAHAILGSPDDLKFRSCLTLFRAIAAPDDPLWQNALDQFYAGQPDEATLRLLPTEVLITPKARALLPYIRRELEHLDTIPDVIAIGHLKMLYHLIAHYGIRELRPEIEAAASRLFLRYDKTDPVKLHHYIATAVHCLCETAWMPILELSVSHLDLPQTSLSLFRNLKNNVLAYHAEKET